MPLTTYREHWEAFVPNRHQLVLVKIDDARVVRVVRVDVAPPDQLPADLPRRLDAVTITPSFSHVMLEAWDEKERMWLFSVLPDVGLPCTAIRELPAIVVADPEVLRSSGASTADELLMGGPL